MNAPDKPFKGNKQALPQKDCATCGKPMTWRKRWANNWAQVLHCSDRCRAAAKSAARHKQCTP